MAEDERNDSTLGELIKYLGIDRVEYGAAVSAMAMSAYESHMKKGDFASIDKAVKLTRLSLYCTSEGHESETARLNNLGLMLESRYEWTRGIADLEAAISAMQKAVDLTPEDHPDRAHWLSNLGNQLESRYEWTKEMADLEAAIAAARKVIDSTPENHPDRAAWLNNFGIKLGLRYERTRAMADLEAAITVAQKAVDLTPEDHPDRAGRLSNLGNQLESRYGRTKAMADLKAAIEAAQKAVDSCPRDHPNRACCLNNLGNKLQSQYELTGAMVDLKAAIAAAQKVIAEDHPDRARWLSNLGNQLESRYKLTGEMADLEAAIKAAQKAVDSTPEDHPDRAGRLSNLGLRLGSRYERTGEIIDLEAAIKAAQKVVNSISEDDPDRAHWLSNLGNQLGRRYERTGEIIDLEAAIEAAQKVVNLTSEDHPNRAGRLSNLGTELNSRYERTGEIVDLEAAIKVAQKAVDSTPEDHPDRAGRLSNLGNQLESRYQRIGETTDLESAIIVMQKAVNSTPKDHPDRARCLNNFGNKLSLRYERTRAITDLKAAITAAQKAVDLTAENHPDRAHRLNNLGFMLGSRYERTKEMADLEAAITAVQKAVDLTPEDHPGRALCLSNLGNQLESRYKRTEKTTDLELSCIHLLEAWNCQGAIPFHRIHAGARVLKLLYLLGKPQKAAKVARALIDLLPAVNARYLNRSDRQHVISTFAGVAANVCAVLLETQGPGVALQYLEKGRVIILGGLIDNLSDVSRLKEEYPDLASRFEGYRKILNSRVEDSSDESIQLKAAKHCRSAAKELDSCLQSIQSLSGFEQFMAPLTNEMMRASTAGGKIIVVNVTELRSDAIIVSSTSIEAIRLSDLSASDSKAWLAKDWKGERFEHGTKNKEYLQYLSWLWAACVKKIFETIGITSNKDENLLPRIWWIGTGLASSMPFHAAGIHSKGSTENALCRAISSYTPSIKALAFARDRASSVDTTDKSLLIATMPNTPGWRSLRGVATEKEAVLEVINGHVIVDELDRPHVAETTEKLEQCSIADFACHGRTDHVDPSNSGLVLQKVNASGELGADFLTVQEISAAKLQHARLAYLSACSTAENKAAQLADEVIHVVSGFQVAGFPHVVGCLWPSVDRVCVDVARGFYASLLQQGVLNLESRKIAAALRRSVMAVREREWKAPLNWAQFVHYGA